MTCREFLLKGSALSEPVDLPSGFDNASTTKMRRVVPASFPCCELVQKQKSDNA
jgi:hypothetical protein